MTSVVTVSATTAAYAAEPVKPASRVTGSSFTEASLEALTKKAVQAADPAEKVIFNVIRPPALALFFLTSENIARGPQNAPKMVEAEYKAAMAMTEPDEAVPEPSDPPPQEDVPESGERSRGIGQDRSAA